MPPEGFESGASKGLRFPSGGFFILGSDPMNTQDFKRKLTAVFSADVAGYSRLMGENEAATVKTLESYKQIMFSLIKQHRGRVIDSPGDNLLAEFGSVVDAVQCGVAVQNELKARNADLPENRKMQFRIGINLGDVIEEQDRIYGDGVNIAARLESCADPGGICVSKTAFDHIETKLPLGYEYLGEKEVKNIAKPVGAYKVLMEPRIVIPRAKDEKPPTLFRLRKRVLVGALAVLIVLIGMAVWNFYFRSPPIQPASVEKMAFPLPDKPSIAVLPFTNMSGDPKEDYFSDGLTEQIITGLSKFSRLFVIARNSTFVYKGKPIKIQKVAEDLGVRYVLEGSVQKSTDRMRISAQLIDALTGRHIWSEQYEREPQDIFVLQDEITIKIMQAMKVEITEGEQARHWSRWGTANLKSFEKNYQGLGFMRRGTKRDNHAARQLFEEAKALDPNFVWVYVGLGWTHFWDARMGWSESPAKSLQEAFALAQKAIAMEESIDTGHSLLGSIYLMMRQYDKAISEGERAIALNPNGAVAHTTLAGIVGCAGKWGESVLYAKQAMRLSPFHEFTDYWILGRAYFMTGQYAEAIAILNKGVQQDPNFLPDYLYLGACYSSMGRDAEASVAAKEVLRINPRFTIESYSKTIPYKDKGDVDRELAALRKAGLPEKPPLPLPDKPSIAVLPFVNMSDDKSQEYFSDGLTEEIITALSKTPKLFVIASNSSFVYKGRPVNVQEVSRELGIKYVLEGSVRRSGDQLRITAQLIDATTGTHFWAERYDRELKDLFSLQDEITMKIITALEVKLTEGEQALVTGSGTHNLDAYLKTLQARELKRNQTVENNHKARRLAEEAINLDPSYAQAYRWLSGTYVIDVWLGSTKSPQEALNTALELVQKALSLDDSLGGAHGLLGNIYVMRKEYEKGVREAERAVELEPNGADAHAFLGMALHFADRAEEAIPTLKKAIRLDPHSPGWYLHVLAGSYRETEKYREAIEWGEKAVQQNPQNVLSRVILCSIYSLAGQVDKARAQADEIMKLNPKFSVTRFAMTDPQKNQVLKKRYIDALREAGLPD
jgi:adenylate cyclase